MTQPGRPPKTIDWKLFENLCFIQCTQAEIASFFNIHKETLVEKAKLHYEDDFPTIYKRFSEGGKCSLRRSQWKMAEKNCSMAIWLGKQYLGQTDSPAEISISEKTVEHFSSLMNQLTSLQKDQVLLRNEASNSNRE